MTPLELAATIFSEATSTEIIIKSNARGVQEDRIAIKKGGKITKEAIDKIEVELKQKVVTKENFKKLNSSEKQKQIAKKSLPDNNEIERK